MKRGLTLIELMLVVVIVLIVMLGLMSFYISCTIAGMSTKNLISAISGARAKIEEIRNTEPFEDIVNNYPRGYTFRIPNWLPNADQCGVVEIDNTTDSTLVQVRVAVIWRERVGRVVGEGLSLNGCPLTDLNLNERIDSPAEVVTLISRRP